MSVRPHPSRRPGEVGVRRNRRIGEQYVHDNGAVLTPYGELRETISLEQTYNLRFSRHIEVLPLS